MTQVLNPGTEANAADLERLKAAVGNLNQLPMLPQAATQALELVHDPDCSLKQLARVIERDPALATGILKLANSALYRVGRTITSLDLAIVHLGLRECRNLIITVGMRSLFRHVSKEQQERAETLWHHSFLTGCLSRRLNRALGLGFQGEEFSCGLSHDLGRLLIALGLPDRFAAVDPLDFHEGPETLQRERDQLGIDHCYFGAWFANVNQLPSSLSSVCQFHHEPAEVQEHQLLVALVAAADDMANYLQRERKTSGYTLARNLGWPLLVPTEDADAQERLAALLPLVLEESLHEAHDVVGFKIA